MLYTANMIRTQVYLPETLYTDIKRRAKAKGETAAQLIREALKRELYEVKPATGQASDKTWKQLVEELNIRGPKDLSSRIDDYLYGDDGDE